MNKRQKLFFVLVTISFSIGITMVIMCSHNEKFDIKLTITENIIVGMVGVIFAIGAISCLMLFLKNLYNNNEDLRIGEHDERNIMIRGKATGISMLITIFVMLIVEFILICTGDSTAALLVAIALFLCGFANTLLICYYQKKY